MRLPELLDLLEARLAELLRERELYLASQLDGRGRALVEALARQAVQELLRRHVVPPAARVVLAQHRLEFGSVEGFVAVYYYVGEQSLAEALRSCWPEEVEEDEDDARVVVEEGE